MKNKKLAIIGASYLQEPLIDKAKEMGIETHVFAWAAGDVGEKKADFFYPISIVEKEQITEKCREIGVDGICTIATDLGEITVNYVANEINKMGALEVVLRKDKLFNTPKVTDNGNYILDVKFENVEKELEKSLKNIVGVIETGLFLGYNNIVIIK